MAICFELVVNSGDNIAAARAAALVEPTPGTPTAGPHRIPLHRPLLRSMDSCIELSVIPVSVGWGVARDGTLPGCD